MRRVCRLLLVCPGWMQSRSRSLGAGGFGVSARFFDGAGSGFLVVLEDG